MVWIRIQGCRSRFLKLRSNGFFGPKALRLPSPGQKAWELRKR